jgi:hypothetical protein
MEGLPPLLGKERGIKGVRFPHSGKNPQKIKEESHPSSGIIYIYERHR